MPRKSSSSIGSENSRRRGKRYTNRHANKVLGGLSAIIAVVVVQVLDEEENQQY